METFNNNTKNDRNITKLNQTNINTLVNNGKEDQTKIGKVKGGLNDNYNK